MSGSPSLATVPSWKDSGSTGPARIGNRADFVGAISQDEIVRYYQDADVFSMPSFAEGVPVVLMEAMAVGVPVVAAAVGGVPELVRDGETGCSSPRAGRPPGRRHPPAGGGAGAGPGDGEGGPPAD